MLNIYRHYGSDSFDITKFEPIKNDLTNKPFGGLWASPLDSDNNWFNYCLSNNFDVDKLVDSFMFKLKNDANTLKISSNKDLKALYEYGFKNNMPINIFHIYDKEYFLNFEMLRDAGYDAIRFYINNETYKSLYGWDCDSLLVLNPDCIVEIEAK